MTMTIEIGDVVKHPEDGDIGVVLDKMTQVSTGDSFYAIHWLKDGFMELSRYDGLEVING